MEEYSDYFPEMFCRKLQVLFITYPPPRTQHNYGSRQAKRKIKKLAHTICYLERKFSLFGQSGGIGLELKQNSMSIL